MEIPVYTPLLESNADGLDILEEKKTALHEGSELARALGDTLREVSRLAEPRTKVKFVDDGVVLLVAPEASVCCYSSNKLKALKFEVCSPVGRP